MQIRVKRAYEDASPDDGFRVLVDRLWPRGVSKERAAIDLWAKDISPTTELRKEWHAKGATDYTKYENEYRDQLAGPSADALAELRAALKDHPVVTLIYSSHDTEHNQALVLAEILKK